MLVGPKINFQTSHYAARLVAAGVSVELAEAAVEVDISEIAAFMIPGVTVKGRIIVDGVIVQYHAQLRPEGWVNVGTIFPVR